MTNPGSNSGPKVMDRFSDKQIVVVIVAAVVAVAVGAGILSNHYGWFSGEKARSVYNSGVKLQEDDRWEDAIPKYNRAIALDPEFAEAYQNRGVSYYNLGLYKRARQDFDEGTRLKPSVGIWIRVYVYGDLYDAVNTQPHDAKGYFDRGRSHLLLGELQQSIDDLDEAIRLDPRYSRAYFIRALDHTLLADDPAAQQDIDHALKLGFNRTVLEYQIDKLRRLR